jgi:predicted metal-binding membrane protein
MAKPDSGLRSFLVRDKLALWISISLFGAAGAAWVASYYLMPLMMGDMAMTGGVAAIVSSSSISLSAIGFFEVVWVIGMTAMMFPAMIPVVLFYNRFATKNERNPSNARVIGTPLFLAGYLLTYLALGLGAYLAIFVVLNLSSTVPWLASLSIVAAGAVLIMTGVYQFTSLKSRCLSKCISPIGFFALHSKNGLFGSLQMGFSHGTYCVGCCWAYMLVMLAVGAMSIPVMAILSGIIALEKVVARGSKWFNRIVAVGFISFGILLWLVPGLLMII